MLSRIFNYLTRSPRGPRFQKSWRTLVARLLPEYTKSTPVPAAQPAATPLPTNESPMSYQQLLARLYAQQTLFDELEALLGDRWQATTNLTQLDNKILAKYEQLKLLMEQAKPHGSNADEENQVKSQPPAMNTAANAQTPVTQQAFLEGWLAPRLWCRTLAIVVDSVTNELLSLEFLKPGEMPSAFYISLASHPDITWQKLGEHHIHRLNFDAALMLDRKQNALVLLDALVSERKILLTKLIELDDELKNDRQALLKKLVELEDDFEAELAAIGAYVPATIPKTVPRENKHTVVNAGMPTCNA